MNVSLVQASAALNANMRWQELISENLASSAIPGFHKQDLSFSAIQAGSWRRPPHQLIVHRPNLLPKATKITNFTPGEMLYTGTPTDIAMEGPGFFEVQLPDGSSAYTRNGSCDINGTGQLLTKQGYPLLSDSGPIQIDMGNPAALDHYSLRDSSNKAKSMKGRIRMVDIKDPHLLTSISGGCYISNDPNPVDHRCCGLDRAAGFY